jgi:hypothetical protein
MYKKDLLGKERKEEEERCSEQRKGDEGAKQANRESGDQ